MERSAESVYSVKDIPAGASVTVELQQQVGQDYTTVNTALISLSGTGGGIYSAGVYTKTFSSGAAAKTTETLLLTFNRMSVVNGNYQLLFKVVDDTGAGLLSVPYRFVVTE